MLKHLEISQFVIIDELTLNLPSGLTVLTGETGAGKSILLDALGLTFGDAADAGMVRTGASAATITGKFTPPANHERLWQVLAEYGFERTADIIIRRVIHADGKDEPTLNGKPITIEALKDIGSNLVEIHGQFANHDLLQPEKQRELLDLFGGYRELVQGTANEWKNLKAAEAKLEEEKKFIAFASQDRDFLTKSCAEFKKMKLVEGEFQQLNEKHQELLQIKRINEMLQGIQAYLVAGSGATRALAQANHILTKQTSVDGNIMGKITEHMHEAQRHVNATVDEVIRLMPSYEVDMPLLAKTEERLNLMKKIAAQHEVEPDQLLDVYKQMDARLTRLLNAINNLSALQDKVTEAKKNYREKSQLLSKARKKAAADLAVAIKGELALLRLGSVEFVVDVNDMPGNMWGPHGIDEVNYTARTNPGSPFGTIAKIASGGELARMMLGLKVILQQVQHISTLVFDEVDTGVGGPTAAAVGERLAKLALSAQVLVVTHSPQVASRGAQHLNVSKRNDGKTTTSTVRELPENERINEIARMLAGDTLTPEAVANAKSLLAESARATATRSA